LELSMLELNMAIFEHLTLTLTLMP
jgi:hypothetical protein